jgi:Family of unknown function (DUF5677)
MREESFEKQLTDLMEEAARSVVPDIVAALRHRGPRMLLDQRRQRICFERRLRKRWAESLDLFEIILTISREAVDNFWTTYHAGAGLQTDFELDALHRIAVRACRVSDEVLCLLRGGFADGAHARWRTLHELACVSLFIRSAGGTTAERYLDFETVERYKTALQLRECGADLTDISDELLVSLRNEKNLLLDRYGLEFANEYGWALDGMRRLVTEFKGVRVKFQDIERVAGNRGLRPYYRISCDQVHAGPTGTAFSLALIRPYPIYLTGASNSGLDKAGVGACLSLLQIVMMFLSQQLDEEALLAPQVLNVFVDEACASFRATQLQIEEEEGQAQEDERQE